MGTLVIVATSYSLRVRVVDNTPARNVSSGVCVGIGGMSARLARESSACWLVLLADVSARFAGAGRVSGVNKFDRHSDEPALVGNLRLQVSESPRVQDAALLSVSPYPRTNVRQVFQRDSSICAFSNTDYLFRDSVIHVSNKSLFASTQTMQDTLGGLRAFGLQPSALSPTAGANTGNLASVPESLTVRTLREIDKAEVNTKPTNSLALSFFRYVHRHIEKPLALAKKQIAFSFGKFKQLTLAFTAGKWQMFQATANSPDADSRSGQLKIEYASIVRNTTVLAKHPLRFLVKLVGIRNLSDQQADDLRRQRELISNLPVELPLKWEAAKLFRLPSQLRKTVSGAIRRFQCLAQRRRLFWRWQQFNLHSQLHGSTILKDLNMSTALRRNNHSVSRLLVHLVFVVKYRRAAISETVWKSLRYGFELAAKRLDLVLVELNHDKDHVHLVVEYPPKVSISDAANALKGNSSFVARRDCKEELHPKLWGSAFWTPSFFAASCGGAPIETLKLYVQNQQNGTVALKGEVSTQEEF